MKEKHMARFRRLRLLAHKIGLTLTRTRQKSRFNGKIRRSLKLRDDTGNVLADIRLATPVKALDVIERIVKIRSETSPDRLTFRTNGPLMTANEEPPDEPQR
jgi:hypothetical protein